ncbi:MAG: hypothetical protein M0R33_15415 [Methylomonas sp.]|jgi:hypothetical protein|nr:hypothetical protein [Methylomonas sp.]
MRVPREELKPHAPRAEFVPRVSQDFREPSHETRPPRVPQDIRSAPRTLMVKDSPILLPSRKCRSVSTEYAECAIITQDENPQDWFKIDRRCKYCGKHLQCYPGTTNAFCKSKLCRLTEALHVLPTDETFIFECWMYIQSVEHGDDCELDLNSQVPSTCDEDKEDELIDE